MSPRKSEDRLAIVRGTLDVLILQSVSQKPLHGFEISLWLDDASGGQLALDDSALYQALHRLEARGLLASEWGVSDNNRRARYYAITKAGRASLTKERARLLSYAKTLTALLSAPGRNRSAR